MDVFLPDIELYEESFRRRQRVRLEGRPAYVGSAEIIVSFQRMYFRPKDNLDIERVVERQRGRFDTAFVRGWLVRSVGEDVDRGP